MTRQDNNEPASSGVLIKNTFLRLTPSSGGFMASAPEATTSLSYSYLIASCVFRFNASTVFSTVLTFVTSTSVRTDTPVNFENFSGVLTIN